VPTIVTQMSTITQYTAAAVMFMLSQLRDGRTPCGVGGAHFKAVASLPASLLILTNG
jgi:hypothetical protein